MSNERTTLATQFIRNRWAEKPRVGIVLGTGLGKLSSHIDLDVALPFGEIPGFPQATALSHAGRLVCGRLAGVPIVAMEGRCHLYEGYTWEDVTLPIRVMHALGAERLVISNACGGLNPQLTPGEILVVVDHIDLMRSCDRSIRWSAEPGGKDDLTRTAQVHAPRIASAYDNGLADLALEVARHEKFLARRGVYLGLTGPNYETRAEYRFLRKMGADVVGMSTVPEVTVAAILGMRVLTLSVVTNIACPDAPTKTTAEDVVAIASASEPRLRAIVVAAVKQEG